MKRLFFYLQIVMMVLALGLCNGCSSSDSPNTTHGDVTLRGVAAKGPVKGGTISAYAITATGQKGALLGTTTTSTDDGSYSLMISHTGAILIEITGGTYTDEATGISTPLAIPLRAAVGNVYGSISVAVTPLTELAVSLAEEAGLSEATINAANAMLSQMLGEEGNILTTQPVDVCSSTACSGATNAQLEYSLLLAAFSQYAQTEGKTIEEIMDILKNDIKDSILDETADKLLDGMADFITDNENNNSGIHQVPETFIEVFEKIGHNAVEGSWVYNDNEGVTITYSGTIFAFIGIECSQLGNYSIESENTLTMSSAGECITPPEWESRLFSYSANATDLTLSATGQDGGEYELSFTRISGPTISGMITYSGSSVIDENNNTISIALYDAANASMEGEPLYSKLGNLESEYNLGPPVFGFHFDVTPGSYQLSAQLDQDGDDELHVNMTTIIEITSSEDHKILDLKID